MAKPGADVIAEIRSAAESLRAAAVEAAAERDRLQADQQESEATRQELLTTLAKTSLPSLDAGDVERTHSGVRQRLRELAERRRRSEEELTARRNRLMEEFTRRGETATSAAETEAAASAAYEQRQSELEAYLATDADYQRMDAAVQSVRVRLERDEARLEEVRKDAAEKLPEYEASRLFTYLRDREFQTQRYAGSGWTKSWDRWLARHIDYASLSESYRFLTTVPTMMEEELAKRRQEADDLTGQMLTAVQTAEVTFGLQPLRAEAEEAGRVRERAESERDRTASQVADVDDQLADLRSRENRFYSEALEELRRFFAGVETEVLERHAAATPDTADDDAVAELRAIRLAADESAAAVESAAAAAESAATSADGLDYVVRRAGQSGLDGPRTSFPADFDTAAPLRQYEKGVVDSKRLLDILKDAAVREPTWAEKAYAKGGDLASSPTAQILLGTAAAAGRKVLEESMRRRR